MARTGKIARLPLAIRDEVCRRLRDGEAGSEILPWLNAQPEVREVLARAFKGVEISDQNLTEWRQGGYEDWLKEQRRVDDVHKLSELSFRLAKAAGGNLSEGMLAVAAGKIHSELEALTAGGGADGEGLDLTKLVSALANIRGLELETIKTRLKEREVEHKGEALTLEKAKFQRQTAELFLKWYDDRRAKEIAAGAETKDAKVAQLVQLWFGDMPEGIGPTHLQGTGATDTKAPREGQS